MASVDQSFPRSINQQLTAMWRQVRAGGGTSARLRERVRKRCGQYLCIVTCLRVRFSGHSYSPSSSRLHNKHIPCAAQSSPLNAVRMLSALKAFCAPMYVQTLIGGGQRMVGVYQVSRDKGIVLYRICKICIRYHGLPSIRSKCPIQVRSG